MISEANCKFQHNPPDVVVRNDGATIVVVTFNSRRTIGRCLDRLVGTLRDHDEVVIVDNSSADDTTTVVQEYVFRDRRIQLLQNRQNIGYAAAANQGARSGRHPYIAFLNPDTLVTPQWIDRLIHHLEPDRTAAVGPLSDCVAGLQHLGRHLSEEQLKAADGDALSEQLDRQYRQQSLESRLLIGFCMMIERHIFEMLGGMDEHLFLGNDDLDLSWRLGLKGYSLSIAKDTLVFHEGQASFATAPKAFTDRLVQESTDYLNYKLLKHYGHGQVPSAQELWSIDWFKPLCRFDAFRPLTSLVMLTYNQLDYTKLCIESLFRHTRIPFELIVVDNGSTDESLQYVNSLDRAGSACIRVHVIANETNTGFANGCNQGIAQSRGSNVILINNDVVVTDGWLPRLLDAADSGPAVGMVGPRTNSVSGPQQIDAPDYDTRTLQDLNHFAQMFAEQNRQSTTRHWRLAGYCLLIKRSVIDKIGGLDPRYKIGNFEDDDYCIRAHLAGFEALIADDCYVHHFGSQTFLGNRIDIGSQLEQNWKRFKQKWGIDPQSPYRGTYHVPLPRDGFDPSRHFIPIDTQLTIPVRITAPEPVQRSIHSNIRSGETEQQPRTNTRIQLRQAKQPARGLSTTILDGVFEEAVKYIASQHKIEAAWILTRLVKSDPNHSRAHHALGLLSCEMGDHDNAQKHLQKAVELDSENTGYRKDLDDVYRVVGEKLYAQAQNKVNAGDAVGAMADLKQVLDLCPEHAPAHNDYGVLSYEQGNKSAALEHYLLAVRLAPDGAVFLKNLADFYLMEQRRAEEAMELYVRVLEKNTLDTDSLLAVGVICAKLEKRDDARTFYRRVLDIEPGHAAAMQALKQLDEGRRTENHLPFVSNKSASPNEATG